MSTFTQILDPLLRTDPGRPLITFYDFATGERTELSVTTYANWVAKASSLLVEECDLERGQRILIDLPAHWLGPVMVGAAWSIGLEVLWPTSKEFEDEREVDAVVCGGTDGVARYGSRASAIPVIASALLPLGTRFAEPTQNGVLDLGVEIWSQPDAFAAWDPPSGADRAVEGITQDEVWAAAAAGTVSSGDRLLTVENPASPSGLSSLTGPLARSGSLVIAVNADPEQFAATFATEHATAHFPQQQP